MPCATPQGEDKWFEDRYGTNDPDKLRDMLCRSITAIGYEYPNAKLDDDIKEWFIKHQNWDKRREELGLKK